METIALKYNPAQMAFLYTFQPFVFLEWGRGAGKSTIFGKRIQDCVIQMPRSTGVMVGASFKQIKTRTIPSTIQGLESIGFIKGLHYVVDSPPPKGLGWNEPYQPPLDYKNSILFYNGTVLLFASQDASATSSRGMNFDWVLGDEAALLDEQLFEEDILASNRGNLMQKAIYPDGTWRYFKDCPLHHSVLLASTTPVTPKGQWVLKYEELAMHKPNEYCFLSFSSGVNIDNLGVGWFIAMRERLESYRYDAEIRNKRIPRVKDGFYPKLDEDKHCYNAFDEQYYNNLRHDVQANCLGDNDLDLDAPLTLGFDWGGSINSMIIAQRYPNETRFLNNLFVLSPKILDDLIEEEFVPYYEHHRMKQVFLFYDPSGDAQVANARKSYAEQAKSIFEKHGWEVYLQEQYRVNELHDVKYKLWNDILSEQNPQLPVVRINRTNCAETFISMANAPAMTDAKGRIKKNKSSERNKKLPQQFATHLSDVMDLIVVGLHLRESIETGIYIPPMMR